MTTIDLPEGARSALRRSPARPGESASTSEQFADEVRLAAAIHGVHRGEISGSKAAGIAGMTRHQSLATLA